MLRHHDPSIGIGEVSDRPDEEPNRCDEWQHIEHAYLGLFLHVSHVWDDEDVERRRQPYEKHEDADSDPNATLFHPSYTYKLPLSCPDDVIDEIPQQRDDDNDMVDAQQCHFPPQMLGCLCGVIVEYFQANGVIVVLPVDLLWLLMVAIDIRIWLRSVLHFK